MTARTEGDDAQGPPVSAENPADTVIDSMSVFIASRVQRMHPRELATAMYQAGLLADPADRDHESCRTAIDHYVGALGIEKARAERVEAENAELRATLDRVRALADKWGQGADNVFDRFQDTSTTRRNASHVASLAIRAALDPEGGA